LPSRHGRATRLKRVIKVAVCSPRRQYGMIRMNAYPARCARQGGCVMPDFMVLLYATEPDETELRERWAELPEWDEVTESLREAGQLVANGPLEGADAARTVRVRDGEVLLTDGPFAVTKEVLAGYYLLRCADLEEALRAAARMPTARYGSVEVRPTMGHGPDTS